MKQRIRAEAKERRAALDEVTVRSYSLSIARQLLALLDPAEPVMVYAAKPPEADTRDLIVSLLEHGTPVIVPIIEPETGTLRLSYIKSVDVLIESTFRVPEPIGNEIPANPAAVRTVIIPMIAFDRRGNRLGYGAGYYDRFLAANPHVRKIGIAFSCQEAEGIPEDSFDIRMDCVVTEKGIIWFTPE